MPKNPGHDRWKGQTEKSLNDLSEIFFALGKMTKDVATAMHDQHVDHVSVEHWAGTKSGITAAEQMLLDIQDKISNKPKATIASLLDKVEAGCVTPKPRRSPKRRKNTGGNEVSQQ